MDRFRRSPLAPGTRLWSTLALGLLLALACSAGAQAATRPSHHQRHHRAACHRRAGRRHCRRSEDGRGDGPAFELTAPHNNTTASPVVSAHTQAPAPTPAPTPPPTPTPRTVFHVILCVPATGDSSRCAPPYTSDSRTGCASILPAPTYNTWSSPLNARVNACMGFTVNIGCQRYSDAVYPASHAASGLTATAVWDEVVWGDGSHGWISDMYVDTPVAGGRSTAVLPAC